MLPMIFRIVDLTSGLHFSKIMSTFPQVGDIIHINGAIYLTVIEYHRPNGLLVESNSNYDGLKAAIHG